MDTEYFDDHWWVTGPELEMECGPYDTKAEAESDRVGMQRFLRHQDKPGFMTGDTNKKAK